VRTKVGDDTGYPPYMIANNKTLMVMSEVMPTSIETLKTGE